MIILKSAPEIEIMREGGKRLALVMAELEKMLIIGGNGKEIEKKCEELLAVNGLKSNFKGYGGYPSVLCISINDTVVHGIPTDYKFKDGDVVSLDCGGLYMGLHTDMAISKAIGNAPANHQRLVEISKDALTLGIEQVKVGNTFGHIGQAIQQFVEQNGFSVIRDLCGHGIGKELHEDPQIINYGQPGGPVIKEGMVFCIEPMIAMGDFKLQRAKDGFSYKTKDGSFTSHYEHMIAVTEKGAEVLSKEK